VKKSFFVILFALTSALATAKEPTNLATFKQELKRYHDSGQYQKDISQVIDQSIRYLNFRLTHAIKDKKPAIVLDIDETSLSNYPNMVKLDFGGTLEEIRQREDEGKDAAITPTLKLYRFAKTHHVAVFFVTGRHEDERQATVANLQNAGFTNWDGLILRSKEYENVSATQYKTAIRKLLTERGYKILLNIGDQKSDLVGGYADKTFKLPDPYYFIP
jgi:acid phosphatase